MEDFALLLNFQFSYRLLGVTVFLFAFLGAVTSNYLKNQKAIYTLIILIPLLTVLNWSNRGVIPNITDSSLRQSLIRSTFAGEGLIPAAPKWINPYSPWIKNSPLSPLELLTGQAKIKVISHNVQKHIYKVTVLEKSLFKENTLYFPGWKIISDNKEIKPVYNNPFYPGVILFVLNEGIHQLTIVYDPPLIIKISSLLSLITFSFCCLWLLATHLASKNTS